ncbi:MAG: TolC family protein [Magnetococcales bacterium]|nr:TolC family protein [Magnetococcales bacterium]
MLIQKKKLVSELKTLPIIISACALIAGGVVVQSDGLAQTKPKEKLANLSWLEGGESGQLSRFHKALEIQKDGARGFLRGKHFEPYSPTKVLEQMHQRSLALAQQIHLVKQAQEDLVVSSAVFDPVVNFSLQYKRYKSRDRKDSISRFREVAKSWETITDSDVGTEYFIDGETSAQTVTNGDVGKTWFEVGVASNSCVIVDGEPMSDSCSNDPVYGTEDEFASNVTDKWAEYWTGGLSLAKFFPWGGSVKGTLNTAFTPYDVSNSVSLKPVGAPLEIAVDLGKQEWSSDFTLEFNTPLPYSKNFGNLGTYSTVNVEQTKISLQKSVQAKDGQVNFESKLALTDYWELVRSMLTVESALLNRSVLTKQLERVKRQLRLNRVTEYDFMLAKSSLEDAKHKEEIAWNDLVVRTNSLSARLDLPPETMVLPSNFLDVLTNIEDIDSKAVFNSALQQRSEVKIARLESDGKMLDKQFRLQQLKPDISMSFSYKALGKGSNAVYGYDSFSSSITSLLDLDERQVYVGLNFSYPLGNKSTKSKYTQSKTSYQRSLDSLNQAEISVATDVTSSLAEARSREARVDMAYANTKLASRAFQATQRLRSKDRVTEFEFIQQLGVLTESRIELINALVDRRLGYINVLAAQGVLGQQSQGNSTLVKGAKP